MSKNINIAIAEDHEIFGKVLIELLENESNFKIIFHARNGVELLFELESNPVDVIILDLNMPVMSGSDALYLLNEKHPKTKVIILSTHDDDCIKNEMYNRGAHAFLVKGCSIHELIYTINGIMVKEFYTK